MTEDNRIEQIREVMRCWDRPHADDRRTALERIRKILDSAPPAPVFADALQPHKTAAPPSVFAELDRFVASYEGEYHCAPHPRTVAQMMIAILRDRGWQPAPPAPRVFFPGDTVPAGVAVMLDDGSLVEGAVTDERWDINDGPVVELLGVPTHEEWQAAVDRARAEREAR